MKYEKPEIECIELNVADIVCTSNGTGDEFQGDAPVSWEDNTDEKPSQDNVTDSSNISENTEKNDGNQSNDNDKSEPNDDEDGLPDEEDNSNTNWGTVF